MNKGFIDGEVSDLQQRATNAGGVFITFTVIHKTNAGTDKERKAFYRFSMFGNRVQTLLTKLMNGQQVIVEYALSTFKGEDGKYKMGLNADNVDIISGSHEVVAHTAPVVDDSGINWEDGQ